MSQQIALRFFVACGLAVGVVACGGDKPDTQPQSGAKVGDAAKDAGKGVADAKSKAETIAKSTSGVKRVVNQLDVK